MKSLVVCATLVLAWAVVLCQPKDLPTNNVGKIWRDCSQPGSAVKIISVTLDPDPPKKGDMVSVKALVTLMNETIENGSISVDAFLDKIPLPIKHDFDLCTESARVKLTCPIKPGQMTLTAQPVITNLAPSGNYSITANITDQANKELLCIEVDFTL